MVLVWFLVSAFVVMNLDAARILVYIPTPSISHQVVFRPLTQELARRGHEVVVITTDPAFPKGETPENLTEIDLHDITYEVYKETFLDLGKGDKDDFMNQLDKLNDLFNKFILVQYNSSEFKEVIYGNHQFDLLIIEANMKINLVLSHFFKAPVILASTFAPIVGHKNLIGAPTHPILYPTALRQRLNNLTFWDKLKELYYNYKMECMLYRGEDLENQMLQNMFGTGITPISKLNENVDMLFLNIHPIFEGNHPVPPGVVYIWGIHKKPAKELPQELKSYLDASKHGVIYMSFGTNTDPTRLPFGIIKKFLKVFCELPYDVLWKWDADELPGRCSNVKIGRWFPQSDLLKHPNIKLFITQAGLQSTDEAISAEVPLIGIPMLGDQWYNAEKYVALKIGVHLDATKFTEEDFKNAVTTVINDKSYRQNIKKLNMLMQDEPLPPLERAVWWTEYVIRHKGAKHLRSPAANISWAQYFELEFVLTLLAGLFVITSLALLVLYSILRLLFQRISSSKKLKNN